MCWSFRTLTRTVHSSWKGSMNFNRQGEKWFLGYYTSHCRNYTLNLGFSTYQLWRIGALLLPLWHRHSFFEYKNFISSTISTQYTKVLFLPWRLQVVTPKEFDAYFKKTTYHASKIRRSLWVLISWRTGWTVKTVRHSVAFVEKIYSTYFCLFVPVSKNPWNYFESRSSHIKNSSMSRWLKQNMKHLAAFQAHRWVNTMGREFCAQPLCL